jgi:hypothetical protein
MKTFKRYLDEVKKPTGDLKDACWTGYTAVGTKKKNGRTVPNCVPEEVMSAAPTNAIGTGNIAGSGGAGGEPGVSKKRNPVMSFFKRKQQKA